MESGQELLSTTPSDQDIMPTTLSGDTEMAAETTTLGAVRVLYDINFPNVVSLYNGSFTPVNYGDSTILRSLPDQEPMIPTMWHRSEVIETRSIPFGVLNDSEGRSAKKRCRCIEKKRRKVVKVIKYIPLAPSIQFGGNKGNFTCKCSHLRKVLKKDQTSTTSKVF